MGSYSLEIRRSAVREIESLTNRKERRLIIERIAGLADDPRPAGAEKLAGDDRYRVRQGPYRVAYEIDDVSKVIRIVKVGHRREAYRR